MQTYSLQIKSYRSWKIDDSPHSDIAKKKFRQLQDFDKLKATGSFEAVRLEVLGLSRTTYYRMKGKYEEYGLVVLELRTKNKVKIAYFAANKDKPKNRRLFNKHAVRWKYGIKAWSISAN